MSLFIGPSFVVSEIWTIKKIQFVIKYKCIYYILPDNENLLFV